MKATQTLHDAGQSLWLDNITRELLSSGTLSRYIAELSVTGLTSNPTIFDHAIKNSTDYDADMRADPDAAKRGPAKSGEDLFFELAMSDITRAADLFRPVFDRTDGRGRLGVAGSLAAAGPRHRGDPRRGQGTARPAGRPNLFIKIPGTREGLPAIEEAIFAGRAGQRDPAVLARAIPGLRAEAYLRGIERRIEAGLNPDVASVASLFISRWDAAVKDKVPEELRGPAGHRGRRSVLQGVSRPARPRRG